MLSFAYVLDRVGYGRLTLEVLVEPMEPLRSISGTTAILWERTEWRDDDGVRTRSASGCSSSLEADERVLRGRVLLWRSRSFSRSLSRWRSRSLSLSLSLSRSRSLSLLLGLVRSRSESFLLRRRCESEELNMAAARGAASCSPCDGRAAELGWAGAGQLSAGEISRARLRAAAIGCWQWARCAVAPISEAGRVPFASLGRSAGRVYSRRRGGQGRDACEGGGTVAVSSGCAVTWTPQAACNCGTSLLLHRHDSFRAAPHWPLARPPTTCTSMPNWKATCGILLACPLLVRYADW